MKMKNFAPKHLTLAISACLAALSVARADTLLNSFDDPFDYVANGIIGNTNWDGVYLRFGDIPVNPNAGGSGNGNTVSASTATPFPGYLNLRNAGGDWSGAGNDGFFLYKVVAGDFDMSVLSVPATVGGGTAFDNRGANFAGLMIRAYHTNHSGAPYSTTVTNSVENSVRLWRFHQFNIDGQIRRSTNGANIEDTYAADTGNLKTNETRYYRIVRQAETNFFFYWKTNLIDGWVQITNAATPNGVMILTNLIGVKLQVGIAQAAFSTANRDAVLDDFQLSGPGVTLPAVLPPGPTPGSIVTTDLNTNSVSISWTTNGGDGSLVIVRANGRVIANPVNGTDYTADTNFTVAPLLGASNSRIVHVGAATNLILTGLGGSNNTYQVAVYSYASGASTVYNTASPATHSFIGPGRVANVSFVVEPTTIPRGGLAVATVTATYDSGDSYDVSSDTSTIWNSSDPSVILAGNGVLSGLINGTANISATYAGVTGNSSVTVTDPVFTDDFGINRDFVANGVSGSPWDGIYLKAGDVPFQGAGNLGTVPGLTTNANANVTSNGVLTVTHRQTGWEGNENDGFLLYKKVPGDFQVAVRIVGYQAQAFHFPGLQARLFNTTNGSPDAAGGTANAANPNGRESGVRWMRFDEFGIATSARLNLNGGNNIVRDNADGDTTAYSLLMRRANGTNFTFFKRAVATDPWVQVTGNAFTFAQALGRSMQVGIGASTFDSGGAYRTAYFDDFMLHAAGITPGSPPTAAAALSFTPNLDGTMTLNWTPGAGSDGSLVVLRASSPVSAHPMDGVTYTANPGFGLGSNLGASNYVVYLGPISTVTVSNLIPGRTYYGAVYSYSGVGAATAYNRNTTIGSQLAIGVLQSITFSLPRGNQLVNAGVLPFSSLGAYSGGITNDVSASVTVFSDPLGHVVGMNGLLTGLTNGPATVYVTFNNVTNSRSVTVRSPTYTDEFNVNHDYLVDRHTNTIWSGVYLNDGDLPGSVNGGQAGFTSVADANVSSNGVLTVTNTTGGWEGAENDAFFLFKYAPADFQMAVQISAFESAAFNNPGLLARAFVEGGAAWTNNGAGEDWVSWTRFDQFNIGTYARLTVNNGTTIAPQSLDNGQYYLLMTRENSTTFRFYQRTNITDAWVSAPSGTTFTEPAFANLALQVGLISPTFNNGGTARYSQFAHFMLDVSPPTLLATRAGGNVVLSWPAAPTYVLQSTPTVAPTAWLPVAEAPVYNNGQYQLTLPATNAAAFFRLVE